MDSYHTVIKVVIHFVQENVFDRFRPTEVNPTRTVGSGPFPWYDSVWLANYESVRQWLRSERPQGIYEFERKLAVLQTSQDFQTQFFPSVLSDVALASVRSVIAGLRPANLQLHEAATFRRFIVQDHPTLTDLQRSLLPLVSKAVGEQVEIGYNFVSLYGTKGVCPIHMDAPEAKWTLDVCIDQSAPWPIHFSRVQPWPESVPELAHETRASRSEEAQASLTFDTYSLEPGQAVLFSGSSQWHYRDTMLNSGSKDFCHLVFFHFIPAGSMELIDQKNWRRLFDLGNFDWPQGSGN